jgi:hypothetical protein
MLSLGSLSLTDQVTRELVLTGLLSSEWVPRLLLRNSQ